MSGRHVDPSRPQPGDGGAEVPGSAADDDGAREGAAASLATSAKDPRRRRVLLIVAAMFLLVVAAIVTYALVSEGQQGQAEPEIPDPITTTLPAPTPEGDPIELDGAGPLIQALPTVVLDHVLTSAEVDEDAYSDHRALEGWLLAYSAPGSDIEVHVLQWEHAEEAAAFAEDVVAAQEVADGEGRRSGDVAVEGESVGRYEIGVLAGGEEASEPSTPADDDAEPVATPDPLGPGMAVWTNGTVAFVATGDAARLAQFYDNFSF